MAIRVFLDHGVRQDHIIFVTFLVAQGGGISVLRHAFPLLKVVCGAIDEGLREAWLGGCENDNQHETAKRKCWLVEPGIGHISTSSHPISVRLHPLICVNRRSLLLMSCNSP